MLDPFLLLSVIFFLASLVWTAWKGSPQNVALRVLLGLGFWTGFIFLLLYSAAHSFTGEGYTDGVTYQLEYGFSGVNAENFSVLIGFGIGYGILTLLLSFFLVFRKSSSNNFLGLVFLILSLLLSPTLHYSTSLLSQKFSQAQAKPVDPNSTFYDYYQYPEVRKIGKPKNLVWIYLEGLESGYLDETLFPDLTPNLKALKEGSIHFTNFHQPPGIGFTIGGMVASQCGIPPVAPSSGNNMGGMDSYLSAARCLGDILSDHGYYLSYHGGARLSFSGKGTFYKTHQFDEVLGLHELKPKLDNPKYVNGWGLYDDFLLDTMYDRFLELGKKKRPFAMLAVTLDTHAPGYFSLKCKKQKLTYKDGENKTLNAVRCSDALVSEFVEKIRKSKYGKDTVVMITSDHLGMRSAASDTLKQGTRRPLVFINLPEEKIIKNENKGSLLDLGSTILPLIGFEGVIGLGRNLLMETTEEADIRQSFIRSNLRNWREELMSFWSFPQIKQEILFQADKKAIFVDGTKLKVPLVSEVEADLSLKPSFSFNPFRNRSKLFESNSEAPFFIVDRCYNTNLMIQKKHLDTKFREYCILSRYNHKPLTDISILSKEEIITFIGMEEDGQEQEAIVIPPRFPFHILRLKKQEVEQYVDITEYLNQGLEQGYSLFSLDLKLQQDQLSCAEIDCDVNDIFSWILLPRHEGNFLVIKDIRVLRYIAKNYPEVVPHVIAQIEDPNWYQMVKENLRYGKVIWDVDGFIKKLEKNNISPQKGFKVLDLMAGSIATSISTKNVDQEIIDIFKDKDVPFYASSKDLEELRAIRREFPIHRFYLDQFEF